MCSACELPCQGSKRLTVPMLDVLRAKLQPGSSYSHASSLATASKRKWGQLQVGSTLCDREECASVFLKRCWAYSSVTDDSRRRQ